MFHFDESKYIPINIEIIRRSGVAPCDCYLLLKANDHLIPFLKQDQPIPISKLRKIYSKESKCMYIQIHEKEKYFNYLSKLFKTPDGMDLLNDLIKQNNGTEIFGIPNEFDLFAYLNQDVKNPQNIENEKQIPNSASAITSSPTLNEIPTNPTALNKNIQTLTEAENKMGQVQVLSGTVTNGNLKEVKNTEINPVNLSANKKNNEEIIYNGLLQNKNNLVDNLEKQIQKIKSTFKDNDPNIGLKFHLKNEINTLLTAIRKINSANKPVIARDINVINNATEFIQTRMLILSKKLQNLDPEFAAKIDTSLKKANENLELINKLKTDGKHLDQFMDFKKYTFALETHLKVLGKRSNEECEAYGQVIQETIETVNEHGGKILIEAGLESKIQTLTADNEEKENLILKLSKLVKKQNVIIFNLKKDNQDIKNNYDVLKSVSNQFDNNHKQMIENSVQELGQYVEKINKSTHLLNDISFEFNNHFSQEFSSNNFKSGLNISDLKSINLNVELTPEIINPYDPNLLHSNTLNTNENINSFVSEPASDNPIHAPVINSDSAIIDTSEASKKLEKSLNPSEDNQTNETDVNTNKEKEADLTSSIENEKLSEIVKILGNDNVELVKTIKALDSERIKSINALINEKRHNQKLTQQMQEEKNKLKDVSGKLLERDLKLKEINTLFNNLKTQAKVESQKKEELEIQIAKMAEEEKQYKIEIAKLRLKPGKAS